MTFIKQWEEQTGASNEGEKKGDTAKQILRKIQLEKPTTSKKVVEIKITNVKTLKLSVNG